MNGQYIYICIYINRHSTSPYMKEKSIKFYHSSWAALPQEAVERLLPLTLTLVGRNKAVPQSSVKTEAMA